MANPEVSGSGRQSLKIINGALDEVMFDGELAIVLRGVVDPDSLRLIQVADYQREMLSDVKIARLMAALRRSRVPDIDLGVRGERFFERNGAFYLQDPVFVIDGLQRITAAIRLMAMDPDQRVHLGALVSFGTTEEWERSRFEDLNLGQTKLSPNVTLRNQQHNYTCAKILWNLSVDAPGFPLRNRITWSQSARRGELVPATTLFGTAGILHSHVRSGGRHSNVIDLCIGLDKIITTLGADTFTANALELFNIVDVCWGVKQVAYREGAVYLRASFLRALALLFSQHTNFWKDGRLTVDTVTRKKLASFPVQDPHVRGLSSSSGKATEMLYLLLVDHVNSGRRTGRLRPRDAESILPESINDEEG